MDSRGSVRRITAKCIRRECVTADQHCQGDYHCGNSMVHGTMLCQLQSQVHVQMQRPLLLAAFVRCVICVHAGRGTALCFCNDCAADSAMMAAAARLHALSIALEGVW